MEPLEEFALVLSYFALPDRKRPPIPPPVNRHAEPSLEGMYYLNFSDGDFISDKPMEVMVAILADYLNWYAIRLLDQPGYEKQEVAIECLFDAIHELETFDEVNEVRSTEILAEISQAARLLLMHLTTDLDLDAIPVNDRTLKQLIDSYLHP